MISDFNTVMRDESQEQAKDLSSLVFDGTETIKGHIDTAMPDLARKFETELSKTGDALALKPDNFKSTLEIIMNNTVEKSLQPVSQPGTAPPRDSTSPSTAEPQQTVSLPLVSGSCNCFTSTRRMQARRKPCFHTQLKRNRKSLAGGLRIFSYLVQIRVVVEYSQQAFLDDLQIQPNFTIRATVPSDSPAFALVGDIVKSE